MLWPGRVGLDRMRGGSVRLLRNTVNTSSRPGWLYHRRPLKTESAERSDALIGDQLKNVAVNGRSYLICHAMPWVSITGRSHSAVRPA